MVENSYLLTEALLKNLISFCSCVFFVDLLCVISLPYNQSYYLAFAMSPIFSGTNFFFIPNIFLATDDKRH